MAGPRFGEKPLKTTEDLGLGPPILRKVVSLGKLKALPSRVEIQFA